MTPDASENWKSRERARSRKPTGSGGQLRGLQVDR